MIGSRDNRHRAWPLLLLVLAELFVLAAAGSAAGPGGGPGFEIGFHYQTSLIGAEDPGSDSSPENIFIDETGHGGGAALGYAFTRQFALLLALSAARHGTTRPGVEASLGSLALEAHYRFLPGESARPYLLGGVGGANVSVDTASYKSEISGGLAVVGAGVLYSLTDHLLIDLSGRLDLLNWTERRLHYRLPGGQEVRIEDPVDESGSAAKFRFGLLWRI